MSSLRLAIPSRITTLWPAARDEMCEMIRGWQIPDHGRPSHAAMLVVVRRGLCISGPNEKNWHLAWRYINHVRPLFSGDVILVTEHGWVDSMTHEAGATPALFA